MPIGPIGSVMPWAAWPERSTRQADGTSPAESTAGAAAPGDARDQASCPAGAPTARARDPSSNEPAAKETAASDGGALKPETDLDPRKQAELEQLRQRDREVRTHEQAHASAGGQYVQGGANFEYQTGPDGRQYAVGGEVSIDASKVPDDPQATIQKARIIRKAALAPAQPSSQDRKVAAKAARMESEARQELTARQQEEIEQARAADEAGTGGPAVPAEQEVAAVSVDGMSRLSSGTEPVPASPTPSGAYAAANTQAIMRGTRIDRMV